MSEVTTNDEIFQNVVAAIVEINPDLEAGQIKTETLFEDIDIDSLDLVEIAQILGDKYDVELKSDSLDETKTVGDAVALIGREAG
jgi:acyl carrier protein